MSGGTEGSNPARSSGESDELRYVSEPAEAHLPLGRAAECSRQLEAAVRFICDHHALPRLSLIAHSWGSIVAGELAGRCPELIGRLVFFGPIARRDAQGERQHLTGWRFVSPQDQWERSAADVPVGAAPVLSERRFDEWGERYLGTAFSSVGGAATGNWPVAGGWVQPTAICSRPRAHFAEQR